MVLQLIELGSEETLVQLHQKGMSKEAWPALQLSSDENLLAHMVNNTVNVYKTRKFAQGTCCCCKAWWLLRLTSSTLWNVA